MGTGQALWHELNILLTPEASGIVNIQDQRGFVLFMKNRLDTRILEILEWPALEEKLASLCASDAGKRLVTRLRPVPFNRIELQMKKISALRGLIERGAPPVLAGIADISIHTALASKGGTLAAEDLLFIRNFTAASGRIRA